MGPRDARRGLLSGVAGAWGRWSAAQVLGVRVTVKYHRSRCDYLARGAGRSTRGYLLLEVLVALMILTATLIPLLTVIGFGSRNVTVAQNEVVALNLAQAYLEEVKDRPAHLVTGVARTPVPGRPGYAYQVTVEQGAENLKTVTVTVWYPAPGGERSVSLTTDKLRR